MSKGGKLLLDLVKKHKMTIANTASQCNGLWTREEGNKRSVIDYIIMEEENVSNVASMVIDEEKLFIPYSLNKRNELEDVYTDHNAILIEIKWEIKNKSKMRKPKIMTRKSYKKFKEMLTDSEISKIWEGNDNLQNQYDKWCQAVIEIKKKCEVRPTKKNVNKVTRKMITMRREIKKEIQKEIKNKSNTHLIDMLKVRYKLLREHIEEEMKAQNTRRIVGTVESLRKNGGGFNEGTFWEFKRKLQKRKEETITAMKDTNGEMQNDNEKIIQIYQDFYQELFETKKSKTEEEKEAEENVEEKFQTIMNKADHQQPMKVRTDDIENEIKKLKNKKAGDKEGWTNEMLKNGGEEMERSIGKMFQKIHDAGTVPKQWDEMQIKSLYKNKGSRSEMKNRRGIFLTNIISKLFERVLLRRTEEHIEMDISQSGGTKGRSTADNWQALVAILDNNRRLSQKTFLVLADAEKCFDKLWLKDCLIDLQEAGMREKEIKLLYNMNKAAKITVLTPAGKTKEIDVSEIVKQGTIFGPIMCCVNSVKVNEMQESTATVITPELQLKGLAYVDDVMAAGNREHIEAVGRNLREMEVKKKYTFNNGNGKSHYMIVKTGRECVEDANIEVEKGKVTKTAEYKYLGTWLNEEGTIETHLSKVEKRIMGMINGMKQIAGRDKVGYLSTQIQLMLYENTVLPALLHNLENWSDWRKKDIEHLERIQATCLKQIFNMPTSTPYWGMLVELGMWDMESRLVYSKMMILHNFKNTNKDRLATEVINQQEKFNIEESWYGRLKKISEEYSIDLSKATEMSKSEWKKMVKDMINRKMEIKTETKKKEMKKLSHQKDQGYGRQEYMNDLDITTVSEIMKTKLKMWDIGKDLGNPKLCGACLTEEESVEHIIQCNKMEQYTDSKLDHLKSEPNAITQKTLEVTKFIKDYIKIRECTKVKEKE